MSRIRIPDQSNDRGIRQDRPIHELELAATIHFVKNLSPGIQKQQAIDKVRALKPKFGEVYVIKIYDELKDKGLLEKGHSQATP